MSSSIVTRTTISSSLLNVGRHLIVKSSTYSSSILHEENRTLLTKDSQSNSLHIMWYRFLLVIVILITAVGNILVCLAIARERKLQNTTNYFLMSLAVADCLVAVLVMPMGMISEVLGYFPFPHYACIIFATMDVLCCTSSIWHMSTMSMDRYFTIRFPFRYGRNKTRRIMLWKIVTVWAISAAISSPVFVLGILDQQNVLSNGICAPNNTSFKIYGSIFAFYIPFIIMIVTYALTMRSLRNVLVNKKKYNRERRRKQTFRPLAQIIHQYAEIAQGIRRSSTNKKRRSSITTTNNNPPTTNSYSSKTPFTIITSTSPTDNRAQFFLPNSQNETNPTAMINDLHQHLTISYIKPSGSKKRRPQLQQQQQQQQQQNVDVNVGNNRTMNNCDMSTLYEITEYSKSTSSSHEVNMIINGNNGTRRSVVMNEKTFPMSLIEHFQISTSSSSSSTHRMNATTTTTAIVNNIVQTDELVEEEDEEEENVQMNLKDEIHPNVYIEMTSSMETTIFTLPWTSCLILLQFIMQYYQQIFPYRLNRLAIESTVKKNDATMNSCHRSTSTSSLESVSRLTTRTTSLLTHRSISTQTHSATLTTTDGHISTNEIHNGESPKRRRFPFHRPMITSPSLFTNIFRYSSGTPIRTSESSTKSSLSWGQRSSTASSSNPTRLSQQPCRPSTTRYSSGVFRRIESEMDTLLSHERRSHGSTSSTSLLHTVYRHRHPSSTQWAKPLKHQQFQSRSAYVINHHPSPTRKQTIAPSSTTNTNSSDSSIILHRYPKFFPTVIHHHHHRHRDDDIVATNERKALRVLMIIFCVFITLWTPFFICTFISAVCSRCRDHLTSNVWFSITWLGYCSSMANPFVYTIFSDVFRRAFTNILLCRPNDSVVSGHVSTKYSQPKGVTHAQQQQQQQMSLRRSPNLDQSRTSTPIPCPPPTNIAGSDATIYLNRCASDSIR